MVLGHELDPDVIRAQLQAAAVPVTLADCRTCSDPCEEGKTRPAYQITNSLITPNFKAMIPIQTASTSTENHRCWGLSRPIVDRLLSQLDTYISPLTHFFFEQVIISTGKSDWDREVTETKGSLAALLLGAQNHANLPISEPAPPQPQTNGKVVRSAAGVFRSSDSTKISILNGSHNTMSDDIDKETVLIFPDYTIVAEVPRTREGAQGLWESAVDPDVGRGGAIIEKAPYKTWVLPYSCVILLCKAFPICPSTIANTFDVNKAHTRKGTTDVLSPLQSSNKVIICIVI